MKKRIFLICLLLISIFIFSCKKNNEENKEEESETFNVSFYDDTTLLQTLKVKKGEAAKPKTPTKTGYDFVSWDKDITNINADLDVKAIFEIKKCTVTFMLDEKTEYKKVTVEYGSSVTVEDPVFEGLEFVDWDTVLTNVTQDLVVHPLTKKISLKVEYYIDDVLYNTEYVDYGDKAIMKAHPTKYGYNFKGWDQDLSKVVKDMKVNGIYETKNFTVTFLDADETVIDTQQVPYLSSATAPTMSDKDDLDFVGWDTDFSKIVDDTEVKAVYKKIRFNITFKVGDSIYTNTDVKKYKAGDELDLPNLELDGYYFMGWTLSEKSTTFYTKLDKSFTGDVTFYASIVETVNHSPLVLPEASAHFTGIRFVDGTIPVYQPIIPDSVTDKSSQSYNWTSSDTSIATISSWSSISVGKTGYCIITATSKTDPSFKINGIIHTTADSIEIATVEEANTPDIVNATFLDKDGNTIVVRKVIKGSSTIPPLAPVVSGFAFSGWDHDVYNIKVDTVFKPIYIENKTNNYQGKSFTIIGDSISTFGSHIPDGFATFYPYPTADVRDVNMTWWMRVINNLGGSLFFNNSYSGTCVADNSKNATKNMSRLEYNILQSQYADVILIFMGANDCASSAVTETMFKNGYKEMLDNLKELCPKAEIVLCTLPTTSFYSATKQQALNKIISDYATEYNYTLVDTSSANLDGHKVDSAHPNNSGMEIVANAIVDKMIK